METENSIYLLCRFYFFLIALVVIYAMWTVWANKKILNPSLGKSTFYRLWNIVAIFSFGHMKKKSYYQDDLAKEQRLQEKQLKEDQLYNQLKEARDKLNRANF